MPILILLMAVVDRFAGEFGSVGTPFTLILLAIPFAVYGFLRGCRLMASAWDCVRRDRKQPSVESAFGVALFLMAQVLIFYLFVIVQIPPDDPSILLYSLASVFQPSELTRKGERQSGQSG